jgi:3-oxoacyl-[acyl-carrier protein] reductase
VTIHGRDAAAVGHVRDAINADGGRAIGVTADLTDPAEVEAMRASVEDDLGPVDILVANAGGNTTPPRPLEQISPDDWKAVIDANLTATFLTLRSFVPGMKDRGHGTIITMSSAAARRPHPASPIGYAAAKAGIELLTQDLAAQVGPAGIRVNCIAPETILTERNARNIPGNIQEELRGQHPIRRLGTPSDVAQAALFLATEQSAWITGVILDVAGGSVLV